jgi:KDO2-lipid IV(A) lauroyltransferase
MMASAWSRGATRSLLVLLWLLQWLPLGLLAALGRGLGHVLYALGGARRHIAQRNIALCLPALGQAERDTLVREHFGWLGRSILERAMLWYAPPARLKRLIHVEGDVRFAERHGAAVMWLVPHFVALEVAGTASQLFQSRRVVTVYQTQSNPVFDAAMLKGRTRFAQGEVFARSDTARPLLRSVRAGHVFLNLPDMDFGLRDAAFVPFFGVPAATLLAPARMAAALGMAVQPVVTEILPGGQGWRVRYLPPWTDFPSGDVLADTRRVNAFIEAEILRNPTQYLWVHRRFKTRPKGLPPVY